MPGGGEAYAARYAGLDHLYYAREWFVDALTAAACQSSNPTPRNPGLTSVDPTVGLQLCEIPLLAGRDETASDRIDREVPADLFDIRPDLASTGDSEDGRPSGVGQVEAKARDLGAAQTGLTAGIRAEEELGMFRFEVAHHQQSQPTSG